ncbi:MAG: hypothetical protein ACT4N2_02895 [Hyphomicrobium sp.]
MATTVTFSFTAAILAMAAGENVMASVKLVLEGSRASAIGAAAHDAITAQTKLRRMATSRTSTIDMHPKCAIGGTEAGMSHRGSICGGRRKRVRPENEQEGVDAFVH